MAETESEKTIYGSLLREKPCEMLIQLNKMKGETYASILAKKVDCTYSHVVKILKEMENGGLIVFNKHGRIKLLSLTKKGKDIANHLQTIKEIINKK